VRNDNHFGKLLEQKKMVDEIDSLFPCLRILLLKNFAISMLVGIFRVSMLISRMHHGKKCYIMLANEHLGLVQAMTIGNT
jgi:hypothetical protein